MLLPKYVLSRFDSVRKTEEGCYGLIRILADHIAGMTDRFAELEYLRFKEERQGNDA